MIHYYSTLLQPKISLTNKLKCEYLFVVLGFEKRFRNNPFFVFDI